MYALREVELDEPGLEVPQSVVSKRPAKEHSYDSFKRVFDLVGACSLLVAVSPIMVLAAVAVKLGSPGPVIFRQTRLTKGNKVFTLLKFRTMVAGAEDGTGAVWAIDRDPRITGLGMFLRKTRIDELPQLFNVLSGEMSLIGPRPERPEIAEQLIKELPSFQKRLEVKAGITGLAQVGTGYASCLRSYRKKLALDLIYIQNRCLLLDLRIALKTILVVVTGTGAK